MFADKQLVSEIKESNKMAFTVIYERYHREIFAFVFKYLQDTPLTEDVVQHVFLRLWETRKQLSENYHLRSYLYSIAKNHTLNTIRNFNTATLKQAEYFKETIEPNPEPNIEKRDMVLFLYRSIEKLPTQKQNICRLKLEEGLSNQLIAERLGISINTVKVLYNQSIKQLRSYMNEAF